MSDIDAWLARLGLHKYSETFARNEIDFNTLRHLGEGDLKELGLPLGPRRTVLAAIKTLGKEDPAASARPRATAERRQLTVMFVDLVGSTALSEQLDPEEMRELIGTYQSTVSTATARHGGHIAKLMGDGVLAYFGWPLAQENDAERAVRSALATAAAVSKLKTPRGDRLAARIGIATGVVVVGDLIGEGAAQEEAVVGETPNLAARLQALAEPHAIVIADATRRLVSGLFDVVDLGRRELRGFAKPAQAWRVLNEASVEGRFEAMHDRVTPLVGRTEELDALLQLWKRASASEGQVVLLSGEAGVGKSRLVAAVQERLGTATSARLRYFCSPHYANTALHPVIRQLERELGLRPDEDSLTKLGKLEAMLGPNLAEAQETMPLLAELLSLDTAHRYPPLRITGPARRARTLDALLLLLEERAARNPVAMFVEDAHWLDPTTSGWLDMVIERVKSLPVLLLVSFRPDFEPPWKQRPCMTALRLHRLGQDEGAALIDLVAEGKIPVGVKDQILAKADGIPLFIEELTKTIVESGLLAQTGSGDVLRDSSAAFAIPSTLQDLLMARLDRLGPAKIVAQTGACIGRDFSHRLLATVIGSDEIDLAAALQQIESLELLLRRGAPPDAVYTFRHALIQDAAYQSLLKSRRQQIHARIASTFEQEIPELAEAEPETMALHYSAGGLAEKAVSYWLKAGRQALKRSANVEAVRHLNRGLELVRSLGTPGERLRREIELQSALGVALMAVKGWGAPEVLKAISRARTLAGELGDVHQMFIALCGEASYYMISGDLRVSDHLGRQCVELAHNSGDPALVLEAHHRQWATKFFLGEYDEARAHADAGMATYDAELHHPLTYIYTGHDPGVCCRSYSGYMLWLQGYPDQGLARCQDAVRLAKQVNHPLSTQIAHFRLTTVHLLRGELEDARRSAELSLALAMQFGFALSISESEFQLGWTLAEAGNRAEGISLMRGALDAIMRTGAGVALQDYYCILARACGEVDAEQGLELVEKAQAIAATGTMHQLPEILRTKGDLLLRLNPEDQAARDLFRNAMAIAKKAGTKSIELRATLSLVQLHGNEGRERTARDQLSKLYAWFGEGFSTRDLVRARKLIEEIDDHKTRA